MFVFWCTIVTCVTYSIEVCIICILVVCCLSELDYTKQESGYDQFIQLSVVFIGGYTKQESGYNQFLTHTSHIEMKDIFIFQ